MDSDTNAGWKVDLYRLSVICSYQEYGYLHVIFSYTGKPRCYFEELDVGAFAAPKSRSGSLLAGGSYL